jgi:uncharacterized radical SAM superfamily Fe-S cluster-containing enzyme
MAELPLPPWPNDPSITHLTLALNYVCNSACSFCFIERELGLGLRDTPEETVAAVFATNRSRRERRFRRLIVSGAEATLRKDLASIVRRARSEGDFDVVRLQTNGRKLADPRYCASLVEAGLSEFFVSVHAPDADLDARLTRAPRSFAQMRRGLASIRNTGSRLITNTCITAGNSHALPAIARFLVDEEIREARFWAFVEFGDVGQAAEHVDFVEVAEPLKEAVGILKGAGVDVRVSWFPACLLGAHADVVDNHRSFTVIHDEFRSRLQAASRFSCDHAESCARFPRGCVGLHERYVERFGTQADRLTPFPREFRGTTRITEAP